MISDLTRFEKYKASGIEQFQRVPRHWEVKRLKNWVAVNAQVLSESTARAFEFDYIDIGCVGTGRLLKQPGSLRFKDAPSRARRVLRPGDTIVSTVRTYLKAVYTVDAMDKPLVASTGFAALSPRSELLPRYLAYVAQSEYFTRQLTSDSVGIAYPSISETKLGNVLVTVPPLAEQAAIIRFLDWAHGRLERAIRAKRKAIALLGEQKQASIYRAVTVGLDASVPQKSAGIPWLGDIPQHWGVLRSKHLFREMDNRSGSGEETHLSMSQRFGLIPSVQIEVRRLVSESYVGAKLCDKGDLVLNRLKAHLGVFAVARENGLVSPDYTVLRPIRELDVRFFEAIYRTPACRVELRRRAKGIVEGFWRLYTDDFYDICVPVPPLMEQKRIMSCLDHDLAGVNAAVARLDREIALLSEYRTRLTSDVMIGEFDVREAAARLPDIAPRGTDDAIDLVAASDCDEEEFAI